MLDDILFVKRKSAFSGCRTYHKPVIKCARKGGRFIISDTLAKLLNVDDGNGLMFGFNRNSGTGYVVRDDEDDAFILKRKDRFCLRFTSKDLLEHFIKTFKLDEEWINSYYFLVNEKPNDKGLFVFTLK